MAEWAVSCSKWVTLLAIRASYHKHTLSTVNQYKTHVVNQAKTKLPIIQQAFDVPIIIANHSKQAIELAPEDFRTLYSQGCREIFYKSPRWLETQESGHETIHGQNSWGAEKTCNFRPFCEGHFQKKSYKLQKVIST